MELFHKRLIYLKELRNVSWSDIARGAGVDRSCISHYAKGRYGPRATTLVKIANYLNVNAEWLAGKDVPMQIENTAGIIEIYSKLNEEGQKKALEIVADYASMPRYKRGE